MYTFLAKKSQHMPVSALVLNFTRLVLKGIFRYDFLGCTSLMKMAKVDDLEAGFACGQI